MKVLIRPECYAEIDYYVQKSTGEVSGLGRVVKHDDGTMEVVKIYLLDQENSAATTDLDPEAVAKLMYESREDEGDLNFWWHSHVNMGVFWSGTDMSTIKQFGDNGYLLATVFNKKKEMRSAFYHGKTDFLPAVFLDELDTKIGNMISAETEEQWKENLKAKSKTKRWQSRGNTAINKFNDPNWVPSRWCKNTGKYIPGYYKGKNKKKEKTEIVDINGNKVDPESESEKRITQIEIEDAMKRLDTLTAMEYFDWLEAYAILNGCQSNDIGDVALVSFLDKYNWKYEDVQIDVLNFQIDREDTIIDDGEFFQDV